MDVDAVIIITNEKETSARKHLKNKHSYYEDFLTNFAHHTRYGKYHLNHLKNMQGYWGYFIDD